jgi:hypothetical protein
MGLAARKLRNARRSFSLFDDAIVFSFRAKTEILISIQHLEETVCQPNPRVKHGSGIASISDSSTWPATPILKRPTVADVYSNKVRQLRCDTTEKL